MTTYYATGNEEELHVQTLSCYIVQRFAEVKMQQREAALTMLRNGIIYHKHYMHVAQLGGCTLSHAAITATITVKLRGPLFVIYAGHCSWPGLSSGFCCQASWTEQQNAAHAKQPTLHSSSLSALPRLSKEASTFARHANVSLFAAATALSSAIFARRLDS